MSCIKRFIDRPRLSCTAIRKLIPQLRLSAETSREIHNRQQMRRSHKLRSP
jgi:hypothetical protein